MRSLVLLSYQIHRECLVTARERRENGSEGVWCGVEAWRQIHTAARQLFSHYAKGLAPSQNYCRDWSSPRLALTFDDAAMLTYQTEAAKRPTSLLLRIRTPSSITRLHSLMWYSRATGCYTAFDLQPPEPLPAPCYRAENEAHGSIPERHLCISANSCRIPCTTRTRAASGITSYAAPRRGTSRWCGVPVE